MSLRRFLTLLLQLVVGVVTAAAVYSLLLLLLFYLGGTECDRGECNFVGEAAVGEVSRWVIGLGFVAISVAVGVAAARAIRCLR